MSNTQSKSDVRNYPLKGLGIHNKTFARTFQRQKLFDVIIILSKDFEFQNVLKQYFIEAKLLLKGSFLKSYKLTISDFMALIAKHKHCCGLSQNSNEYT